MSYDSVRMNEQIRILDHSIDHFIDRYNFITMKADMLGEHPARQTLFLFPGGIASKLKRATRAWRAAGPTSQIFNYERAWGTEDELLGGVARDLKMRSTASGYRDKENRIIIADGVINLFGASPYLFFTAWCSSMQLDWFIFPWDWRRSVDEIGTFFIDRFLPHFQERVQDECNNADPLADYSLIGHSAGGLVVNWILRNVPPLPGVLRRVITVAAPFYGYGGQLHRWFEGDPWVNEGDLYTQDIIKTISSFPGSYSWHFLPEGFYNANQVAFQNDPAYPLASYPSVDLATNDPADPYYPQPPGKRYPTKAQSGFDLAELAKAKMLFDALTSPLSPVQAAKLVNIRGVTTDTSTPSTTTWQLVPPITPSPITDTSIAPGDGTQPGWTTRDIGLANQVPANVITVIGGDAAHFLIMDSPQTFAHLAVVLGIPWEGAAMAKRVIAQVSAKTSEEALDFVRKMQKAFAKKPRAKKEQGSLRKYLAKFTDAELRAVGWRVLSDLMQRPPRTIREGDLPPAPNTGPEPYRAPPRTSESSAGTKTKKRTNPKGGRAARRTSAVAKPRSTRRRSRRS